MIKKKPVKKTASKKLPYVVVRTYSRRCPRRRAEVAQRKGSRAGQCATALEMVRSLHVEREVAIEGIKVGSKPSIAIPEIVLTEAIEIVKTSPVAGKDSAGVSGMPPLTRDGSGYGSGSGSGYGSGSGSGTGTGTGPGRVRGRVRDGSGSGSGDGPGPGTGSK